jgi:hypothetical protein
VAKKKTKLRKLILDIAIPKIIESRGSKRRAVESKDSGLGHFLRADGLLSSMVVTGPALRTNRSITSS